MSTAVLGLSHLKPAGAMADMSIWGLYAKARLYRSKHRSRIFNAPRSFWDRSYGATIRKSNCSKVVVLGFPKSGNTWLMALLADYLQIPTIDPVNDRFKYGVGISHLPFTDYIGSRTDFRHAACLVRDPRDVIVSFFHYSQTDHFRAARPEFHYNGIHSFYYDWFLSRSAPAHIWETHAETYARLGVPIVRYEALKQDTAGELQRLLLRWGLPVNEERIQGAVAANDIKTLRESGKKLHVAVPPSRFRRGVSGGYKDDLPAEIQLDIEKRFSRIFERWGYEKDLDVAAADLQGNVPARNLA